MIAEGLNSVTQKVKFGARGFRIGSDFAERSCSTVGAVNSTQFRADDPAPHPKAGSALFLVRDGEANFCHLRAVRMDRRSRCLEFPVFW